MHHMRIPAVSGTAESCGRRIGWTMTGTGRPAVVLESGLSGGSVSWAQVVDKLAPVTSVLTYDRAGYGRSDPTKPTPEQAVEDLRAVLDDATVREPIVLVGHSWGGVLVRIFAGAYPERVAALILLDATHENLAGADSRVMRAVNAAAAWLLGRRARKGRLSQELSARRGRLARLPALVPEEHRPALVEHLTDVRTWEQTAREAASVPRFIRAVRTCPAPHMPVTALVGGRADGGPREAKNRRQVRSVHEAWLGPEHVRVVPEAGHMLPLEAPHAVANVVTDVVLGWRADQDHGPGWSGGA